MNLDEELFRGCIPEERFVQEHAELQCPADALPGGYEWSHPVFVLHDILLCSLPLSRRPFHAP